MLPQLAPAPPPPRTAGSLATRPDYSQIHSSRELVTATIASDRARIRDRGEQNVVAASHRGVDVSHLFDATPAVAQEQKPRAATSHGSSRPGGVKAGGSGGSGSRGLVHALLTEAGRLSKEEAVPPACLPGHFRVSADARSDAQRRFLDGDRPSAVFPAALPTSRADVIASISDLERRLELLDAAGKGGGSQAHQGPLDIETGLLDRLEVLDSTFVELVRQNLVGCVERGVLLEFVRVSIFGVVNALVQILDDAKGMIAEAVGERDRVQATVDGLRAKIDELQAAIRIKDSATRREQILQISGAAKRSKEYVEFATAQFTKHNREQESEEQRMELRRRLFSIQLSSNVQQQETKELYQQALNRIAELQGREDAVKERLRAAEEGLRAALLNARPVRQTLDVGTETAVEETPPPSSSVKFKSAAQAVTFAVTIPSPISSEPTSPVLEVTESSHSLQRGLSRRQSNNIMVRRQSSFVPPAMRARFSIANSLFSVSARKQSVFRASSDEPFDGSASRMKPPPVDSGSQTDAWTRPSADALVDAQEMRHDMAVQCSSDVSVSTMSRREQLDPIHGWYRTVSCATDVIIVPPRTASISMIMTPAVDASSASEPSTPSVPMVKESAFEAALRRVQFDKAKSRTTKWTISLVSQIYEFITEREPIVASDTDVSALALLFFRTKYGLEKLSDQYIAEFISSARRDIQAVRRVTCFVRFVGLARFFGLKDVLDGTMAGSRTALSANSLVGAAGDYLPWNMYAHYSYLLVTMRRLLPRKAVKELDETEGFELQPAGVVSFLKQCYKKRLSDAAFSELLRALNQYDVNQAQAAMIIPPLVIASLETSAAVTDSVRRKWRVDLLIELLAFSSNHIFKDLVEMSKVELGAMGIPSDGAAALSDPKMWNPQLQ